MNRNITIDRELLIKVAQAIAIYRMQRPLPQVVHEDAKRVVLATWNLQPYHEQKQEAMADALAAIRAIADAGGMLPKELLKVREEMARLCHEIEMMPASEQQTKVIQIAAHDIDHTLLQGITHWQLHQDGAPCPKCGAYHLTAQQCLLPR